MGKHTDQTKFDKGQSVIARQLGQSIPKTTGLVGCSWYAKVSTYQKWKEQHYRIFSLPVVCLGKCLPVR